MNLRGLLEDEAAILLDLQEALKTNPSKVNEAYRELQKETHVLEIMDAVAVNNGKVLDPALLIMLLSMGDGKPGKCVEHLLWTMNRAEGLKFISFSFWCEKIALGGVLDVT